MQPRRDTLAETIAALDRAARNDPEDHEAQLALGLAWLEAGECKRAIQILSRVSAPARAARRARLAIEKARAMAAEPRAPAPYVRHLFDQFAPDYDRKMLAELNYQAPAILRALLTWLRGEEARDLSILDLGCGTGLSGIAFHDVAKRIEGIDLSPGMIRMARARGIYDELHIADLAAMLKRRGARFDLIVAADTLVYLGNLAPVLMAARKRLAPDGLFLFTVESKPGKGYILGEKRRYRHSETYLRRLAKASQFEIAGLIACSPREDAGRPVEGFAVALW